MNELRERSEPYQAFGNPDQLRLRNLDQAEAGRDNVHFLFPSLPKGWAAPQPDATPGAFDRTGPTPGVKSAADERQHASITGTTERGQDTSCGLPTRPRRLPPRTRGRLDRP